jgi:hypothetical protein
MQWSTFGSGTSWDVQAVLEVGGSLYVGGDFGRAGDKLSSGIARWDSIVVPVFVSEFEGVQTSEGVDLRWKLSSTGFELRGVHVERADSQSGPYVNLTEVPLSPQTSMWYRDVSTGVGPHWYRLVLLFSDGAVQHVSPIRIDRAESFLQTSLSVPFEGRPGGPVHIHFVIGPRQHTPVRLEVYDIRGRLVRRLEKGFRDPGRYSHEWDRLDEAGVRARRGVYLIRLIAGASRINRKIVIVSD